MTVQTFIIFHDTIEVVQRQFFKPISDPEKLTYCTLVRHKYEKYPSIFEYLIQVSPKFGVEY